MKIIMHIDVNNAFLSWTAVFRLKQGEKVDIRNTYAIIGGDEKSRHGIVLAKSMPAKKRGVVTAETIYSAKKKCPNLEVYPPNYSFYKKMSDSMFNLIRTYSPDIEQMSIDECFLDYTPVKHLYGDEVKFAYDLKKRIKDELGFTVNVGIANNKLCAKMASDFSKPYKVHTLYANEVFSKMWPLKVDDLFGIGRQTALKLHKLNINTIYDLSHTDRNFLYKHFKNQAVDMIDRAWGRGSDVVKSEADAPKGIGNEVTLKKNIFDKDELKPYLLALAENVSLRLRKEKKYAYVVVVTVKDRFFKRFSHQKKLVNATQLTEEVYKVSCEILNEMNIDDGIRLIGIRLDKLTDSSVHQVSLFEDLKVREGNNELERTVDRLKEKYGFKIIKKAGQIDKKISKKY
ncbi:MAG: DNA polymerase IV [Bacilli bacterium]|nr:DNA polymerase IV [Bacilli bacterium]